MPEAVCKDNQGIGHRSWTFSGLDALGLKRLLLQTCVGSYRGMRVNVNIVQRGVLSCCFSSLTSIVCVINLFLPQMESRVSKSTVGGIAAEHSRLAESALFSR